MGRKESDSPFSGLNPPDYISFASAVSSFFIEPDTLSATSFLGYRRGSRAPPSIAAVTARPLNLEEQKIRQDVKYKNNEIEARNAVQVFFTTLRRMRWR